MGSSLSDLETDPGVYSLIFDGLLDESPEALQRLKGVFIADLDLTVPEVQAILENGKGIVCTGEHESDLASKLQLLKELGAAVYVVGPQSEAQESAEDEETELAFCDEFEVTEESYEADSEERFEEDSEEDAIAFSGEALEEDSEDEEADDDEEEFELEFSLDEMLVEQAEPVKKTKRSTVHIIDEETSLDDTLSELGIEASEEEQEFALDSTVPAAEPDVDVSFADDDFSLEPDTVKTPESHALDNYSAKGIESEDSLFGEPIDPQTGKLESNSKAPVGSPKVNEKGIIPESAISGELSFELTSMDEETPAAEEKAKPVSKPAAAAAATEPVFDDLTLQPEVEDNLVDTSLKRQSDIEDVDLSITPASLEEDNDGGLELSPEPEVAATTQPTREAIEEKAPARKETVPAEDTVPAGNALFSGVDLDSMLDSVADIAAKDLDEAGIEAAIEERRAPEPAAEKQSLIEVEPTDDLEQAQPVPAGAEQPAEPVREISLEEEVKDTPVKAGIIAQEVKQSDAARAGKMKAGNAKPAPLEEDVETGKEELAVKPAKKKKESKIPLDVAVIVILGAAILFAGNWYYVSQSKTENDLEQSRIKMEILKIQKEAKLAQKAQEKEKVVAAVTEVTYSNRYEGQFKENGVLSRATAVISETTVELAEFVMRGPKPQTLSDMEIIEGKVIDPWLSKVTVDPLTLTLSENGTFSKEVPLKVFISDQGKNDRFHSKGVLEGSLDREARLLTFSLYVKQGGKEVTADTGASIKRTEDGFAYTIKGTVATQALPEEEKK